jgi:pimeloyl-ACP methyl ester carboxylesterase
MKSCSCRQPALARACRLDVFRLVILLVLFLAAWSAAPQAREVTLRHGQLELTGNLELAPGKTIADGVLLITHGTLAHNRMELIRTLQELLKERGINTLAINLSLGITRRRGMYDCNQPMRHRHEDAIEEIAAWVKWLREQGAGRIWLLGHSRGGNQTAWYAATQADPLVEKVILLAPMTYDPQKAATAYQRRFGVPLRPVLDQARSFRRAGRGGDPMEVPGILYCKDARATPDSFLSYHAPDPRRDTPYWIPRLKLPVLVIAAAEDQVVPDLLERMKPLADGKRVRLRVIEDADHFFRDFAAEDTADAIAAFIREG